MLLQKFLDDFVGVDLSEEVEDRDVIDHFLCARFHVERVHHTHAIQAVDPIGRVKVKPQSHPDNPTQLISVDFAYPLLYDSLCIRNIPQRLFAFDEGAELHLMGHAFFFFAVVSALLA